MARNNALGGKNQAEQRDNQPSWKTKGKSFRRLGQTDGQKFREVETALEERKAEAKTVQERIEEWEARSNDGSKGMLFTMESATKTAMKWRSSNR